MVAPVGAGGKSKPTPRAFPLFLMRDLRSQRTDRRRELAIKPRPSRKGYAGPSTTALGFGSGPLLVFFWETRHTARTRQLNLHIPAERGAHDAPDKHARPLHGLRVPRWPRPWVPRASAVLEALEAREHIRQPERHGARASAHDARANTHGAPDHQTRRTVQENPHPLGRRYPPDLSAPWSARERWTEDLPPLWSLSLRSASPRPKWISRIGRIGKATRSDNGGMVRRYAISRSRTRSMTSLRVPWKPRCNASATTMPMDVDGSM